MTDDVITAQDREALAHDVVVRIAPSPQFEHDCDKCQFLGTVAYTDAWSGTLIDCDLYCCLVKSVMDSSLIARYGNEGREYSSFPRDILETKQQQGSIMGSHTPALMMALLLVQHAEKVAKEKGGPCKECGDPSPKGNVFCGAACSHEYERKNS